MWGWDGVAFRAHSWSCALDPPEASTATILPCPEIAGPCWLVVVPRSSRGLCMALQCYEYLPEYICVLKIYLVPEEPEGVGTEITNS